MERQLQRGILWFTPETTTQFGQKLRDKITANDQALRKVYVKMIAGQAAVSNDMITIAEAKLAMANALILGDKSPSFVVPSFDRK